jgi:phage/plasmid-like protein (TIGR03299 family)
VHNLEQINGETAFVAYREAGWHGLGQVVEEELTAQSAIEKAMLDWTVELHPLQSVVVTDTGVEIVDVKDKFATIRKHPLKDTRDALGVVGTRYTPIQNKEVFNFLDALVDSGSSYETAGSIDGGKKIFITMRMPNGILVGGKDKSDMYIFATTSHDGSFSLSVALTAVRVVCQNTWRMARRASQYKHTIRHTANSNKSIAEARDVMQLSFEYGGFLQEQADKLTKTTVTNSDVDEFLSNLFPVPLDIAKVMGKRPLEKNELKVITMLDTKKDTIKNLYHNSPGQQMLDNNAWRLFNSVTEYADYYSTVRGSDTRRAERVVLAEGEVLKDRALDLLLQ